MTGEMSKAEVTRENFPVYFAAADTVPGATVEPFDQYQGPYVLVPGKGRYFMSSEDGVIGQWFAERTDSLSAEFLGPSSSQFEEQAAVAAFLDLLANGGTPVDRTPEPPRVDPPAPIGHKLRLRTPGGDVYIIHPDGNIERTDMEFTPSGEWKMLGLVRSHPFGGGFVPRERITPEWLAANSLRFKNGKPRYRVRDRDHGTTREWGQEVAELTITD